MFKELIFANKKTIHNNHLSLEISVLIRVFFIKYSAENQLRKSLASSARMDNCKHHCSLDSQATKKLYVNDKRMEIEARPWNAFNPYLFK